jgi:hypothetical protein
MARAAESDPPEWGLGCLPGRTCVSLPFRKTTQAASHHVAGTSAAGMCGAVVDRVISHGQGLTPAAATVDMNPLDPMPRVLTRSETGLPHASSFKRPFPYHCAASFAVVARRVYPDGRHMPIQGQSGDFMSFHPYGPNDLVWQGLPSVFSVSRAWPGGRVAPEEGFEPPTQRLTAACSTTELLRNNHGGADRTRTGVHGFAGRCVATPPPRLGAQQDRRMPGGPLTLRT